MGETITAIFSSRVLTPLIMGFIFSIVLGPIFIPVLHKLKFGQNIRKEGPKSHQRKRELQQWEALYSLFQ